MTCKTQVLFPAMQQAMEQLIQTAIRNWVASRMPIRPNNQSKSPTTWTRVAEQTLLFPYLAEIPMRSSIDQTNRMWIFLSGKASSARSLEARSMPNRRPNSRSTTIITMEVFKWARKAWLSWDRQTRSHQMAPMAHEITHRLKAPIPRSRRSKVFQRPRLGRSESILPFQALKDRTRPVNNAGKTVQRIRTSLLGQTWQK